MERLVPGGHRPLRQRYSFEKLPSQENFHKKFHDINYWKAKLAFRGASSVGDVMIELIERCIDLELPNSIHPRVAVVEYMLSREWAALRGGENELEDDEDEVFDEEVYDADVEDGGDSGYEDYDEYDEDRTLRCTLNSDL